MVFFVSRFHGSMNKELIENISLQKNKKGGCLVWKHCLSNTYCSEVLKDLCVTAPYLYKAVSDGFKQLHGLAVVSLVVLQQSLTHGQPHTLSYLELMVFCWVSEGGKQRHLTNAKMDISVIVYSFLCHSIYNKYDFFFFFFFFKFASPSSLYDLLDRENSSVNII